MPVEKTSPLGGTIARLMWMLFGPIMLTVLAIAIAAKVNGFSLLDIAYFSVLAATIAGRWVEFRCGDPQTSQGEPATRQHLRRYILAMSIVGPAVWGLATLYRML